MRFRLLVSLVCLLCSITACQEAPPTVIVLVVTETPQGTEATQEAGAQIGASNGTPSQPTATSTPSATSTPDPRPTATVGQIQVAEQPFENGRMFWVQPLGQIWVLVMEGEGHGRWSIYEDTFAEGEPETDPAFIPPDESVFQPSRGFGKLWRENPDIRQALGWAVTPTEFGYISRYEYYPGGTVLADNTYQAGPGYHILFSLYEEAFRFNEADQTWQLGRGD
jgi:hypothetical protein